MKENHIYFPDDFNLLHKVLLEGLSREIPGLYSYSLVVAQDCSNLVLEAQQLIDIYLRNTCDPRFNILQRVQLFQTTPFMSRNLYFAGFMSNETLSGLIRGVFKADLSKLSV